MEPAPYGLRSLPGGYTVRKYNIVWKAVSTVDVPASVRGKNVEMKGERTEFSHDLDCVCRVDYVSISSAADKVQGIRLTTEA